MSNRQITVGPAFLQALNDSMEKAYEDLEMEMNRSRTKDDQIFHLTKYVKKCIDGMTEAGVAVPDQGWTVKDLLKDLERGKLKDY